MSAVATTPRDLADPGPRGSLRYRTGPFVVQLESAIATAWRLAAWCYGVLDPAAPVVVDFNLRLRRGAGLRRWWRPQARFAVERLAPFEPYPADHAFPLLEWGTNWCIALRAHQYLMLHAGVVERGGRALILPALPGSGKSTLSAALAFRGWRFLTDEIGLLSHGGDLIHPLPRAVPLKNRSIDIIRASIPQAEIGPVFEKTRKGTVAHLKPPSESLDRQREPARPAWILFPRFRDGSPTRVRRVEKSLAFTRLAQNAFNYDLLGATGFTALCRLIGDCDCWSMDFGDLDQAMATLDDLTSTAVATARAC